MATTRKLLLETTWKKCGHFFQAWTETQDDGSWELHFHVEGDCCDRIATDIANEVGANVKTYRVD
jgi:hypothetical protein